MNRIHQNWKSSDNGSTCALKDVWMFSPNQKIEGYKTVDLIKSEVRLCLSVCFIFFHWKKWTSIIIDPLLKKNRLIHEIFDLAMLENLAYNMI